MMWQRTTVRLSWCTKSEIAKHSAYPHKEQPLGMVALNAY
jgi:hypothetical protein